MIKVPQNEFIFTFSRSSGAGGQNVNKVNSKATLTWNMQDSTACSKDVKKRFIEKYNRYIIDGNVVISSQKMRSQNQNIEDCIAKLHVCLNNVEFPPKKRKSTKPTKSSVKKRLDKKSKHSKLKKMRREKF